MNILSRIFKSRKSTPTPPPDQSDTYSYCETLAAYSWHIRPLTSKGKKFGGGADTLALCGAKASWDLIAPITLRSLQSSSICATCRRNWTTRMTDWLRKNG